MFLDELQELEREGAGMMHKVGKPKKEIFMKSSPSQMPIEILKKVVMSEADYNTRFRVRRESDANLITLALPSHPQHDEIVDWYE